MFDTCGYLCILHECILLFISIDLFPCSLFILLFAFFQVKVYGCLGGDEIHSDSQPFIPSSELPKNATALRGRRGAIKFGNANEVQGHLFLKKFFRQPVYCSLCHEFIWGFGKEVCVLMCTLC